MVLSGAVVALVLFVVVVFSMFFLLFSFVYMSL